MPLSGMLYALAIEPFLHKLRMELKGCALPTCQQVVRLSAYADDIIVMIDEQRDIDVLIRLANDYTVVSSAKINWEKSEAFLVGGWSADVLTLPQGLLWKRDGIKYLGVFLGDEQFEKKNWEGVVDKMKGRLNKWKWLVPQLSYRGRVLIINILVASALWYNLPVSTHR